MICVFCGKDIELRARRFRLHGGYGYGHKMRHWPSCPTKGEDVRHQAVAQDTQGATDEGAVVSVLPEGGPDGSGGGR